MNVKNHSSRSSTTAVQIWIISYPSHHVTPHGRNELNNLTSLPTCGFIAQLVEHRTGIAEVTGSNPVEALIFFRLLLSNCLNWKINCDDHSSHSSTTAVQIWIISYTSHHSFIFCLLALGLLNDSEVKINDVLGEGDNIPFIVRI